VSDRSGGFGGRDIYKSMKDENGEWGKAENLGATVNTEFEEDAPFIHPDGVTLFFSSNGHNTMGGFDIFYTTISDDGVMWNTPVNVGYPVNSTNDDVFYVVSPDKTKAYYSSFKEGGLGEKDNFMITFPDQTQTPLVVVKGKIIDSNNNVPKGIEITLTDNVTGKVLSVYRPNKLTGNYLFVLIPGKNYNISYEADGFMFYSENRIVAKKTNFYETYKSIQLPPIMVGSRMVLNNIFFDFDKSTLRQTSNVELKNIVRFLKKYPKINVEMDGYTDSKGTPEYNMTLSLERANAVINYITTNGIEKSRLSAKGFGESKPDASNLTWDGEDNPEGRQLNRRVEMKIVEIK
jgi:outer membrane protein OmpA-like peptidoglycan-associated protein